MTKTLFTLLCIFFITTVHAQNHNPDKVLVLEDGDGIPRDSKFIAEIASNAGGFDYNDAIEEAKIKTAKKGGNIFMIMRVVNWQGMRRFGYQLVGRVYYTSNIEPYLQYKDGFDTTSQKLISDTAKYAYIYFYHTPMKEGVPNDFIVNLNGKHLCTLQEDSSCRIKIDTEGDFVLSQGNKRKKVEHPLRVQFGKVYFVKCSVRKRGAGKYYSISTMYPNQGYTEYKQMAKH